MSTFYVAPEIYAKYRDDVVALSNSVQRNYAHHLDPATRTPALSDAQIGERLGLDEATVREIRCVAEREFYSLDEWQKAIEFKERACREYARSGLSSVTGRHKPQAQKNRVDPEHR